MKRSYIVDRDGALIACDAIISLMFSPGKTMLYAVTAPGARALEECTPETADGVMERWAHVVFGGPQREAVVQ